MYGSEIMDVLRPSVNNPVEVLRAIDTVLTIIFPEAQKSQDNFKRIAAAASSVWQRLMVGAPDAEVLRNDLESILTRSMEYYKRQ